jgi:hypothetical protein
MLDMVAQAHKSRRLRQEDQELQISLRYTVRLSQKKKNLYMCPHSYHFQNCFFCRFRIISPDELLIFVLLFGDMFFQFSFV